MCVVKTYGIYHKNIHDGIAEGMSQCSLLIGIFRSYKLKLENK